MAIVIVPLSLKTSAKDLQSKASYAVYSMLGTLGFHFCGGGVSARMWVSATEGFRVLASEAWRLLTSCLSFEVCPPET